MTAKISLDKNQQTVFLKQTIRSGLLRQNGSTFYVDPQTISWGEYKAGFDHIRVFSQYYRRFCENTTSQAELNRIYYFIQMIPYLNWKTNILAHNQTEQDPERLAQLGAGVIELASSAFSLFFYMLIPILEGYAASLHTLLFSMGARSISGEKCCLLSTMLIYCIYIV